MGVRKRKVDGSGSAPAQTQKDDGEKIQREGKEKAVDPPPAVEESQRSAYRTFFTRIVMGACMIAFFTVVLNSDHAIIALFVIGLSVLAFKEILGVKYIAAKKKPQPPPIFRSLNWYFLATTLFYVYGQRTVLYLPIDAAYKAVFTKSHMFISFALYCIGFMTFILTLQQGMIKYQMAQMTWTIMTLLVVVVQSTSIISNLFEGIIWFLLPCAIVVCNDIFAYFSGFFLGKKIINKPFLSLSPKKTWEGFIGATFWTILFAILFADFLSKSQWFICPRKEPNFFEPLSCQPDPVFQYATYHTPDSITSFVHSIFGKDISTIVMRPIILHAVVLALFGSLIAPFGGFYASAIKRACGVKDFDTIFPGHGGFTDRTDCQYIMGLFTYVYYHLFIRDDPMEVDVIYANALLLPLEQQVSLLHRLNISVTQAIAHNASRLL